MVFLLEIGGYMGKNKCSEHYCSGLAQVVCDCQENFFLCGTHGYQHYKATGHDLKDLNHTEPDFNFLDIDYALLKSLPLKYIEIDEGPSFFRKAVFKHLKKVHPNRYHKFGITKNLKKYLFKVNYKVLCFICQKGVSYIKLHLIKKHGLTEASRKSYWDQFEKSYSSMGIHLRDII